MANRTVRSNMEAMQNYMRNMMGSLQGMIHNMEHLQKTQPEPKK
jgi:hypothetical protein